MIRIINKLYFNLKKKFIYFVFFAIFSFFAQPAFAYAGPGVAIGAVIIFITVIITFFASLLITIARGFKKIIKYTTSFIRGKNKFKKKKFRK